jgi:hypothetical protein
MLREPGRCRQRCGLKNFHTHDLSLTKERPAKKGAPIGFAAGAEANICSKDKFAA